MYPITVFITHYNPRSEHVKSFTSKKMLLHYLKDCEEQGKEVHIAIIFTNDSHLDDPIFLGKLASYQFNSHVRNYHAAYSSKTHTYTISFYLNKSNWYAIHSILLFITPTNHISLQRKSCLIRLCFFQTG